MPVPSLAPLVTNTAGTDADIKALAQDCQVQSDVTATNAEVTVECITALALYCQLLSNYLA